MAEAVIEESVPTPETKFFCHKCSVEIPRVLPDYTCPNCYSGFIEEIEPLQEDDIDVESGDESSQQAQQEFLSFLMGDLVGSPAYRRPGDPGRVTRQTAGGPMRSQQQRHAHPIPLENLIQDFIVNITGMEWGQVGADGNRRVGAPVSFFLGNPGDYAWGREGLDTIITQLLNQMDGTGPPPLAKDKIQSIPSVQITIEQTDQNLQCSVCWEDFILGENVRKLPCEHFYHEKCIIPWLELHGTCPICRKVLNEEGGEEGSRGGASSANTTNSLPQSLAALFRAAAGRDSMSQDSTSSGGSGSNSSSTTAPPSTATRPNTRSQRNPPPQDQFWDDFDLEFD